MTRGASVARRIIALDITGHGTWSVSETGRRVVVRGVPVLLRWRRSQYAA